MKSSFQPDADYSPRQTPALIDLEAFDVSEQQFAASLEDISVQPESRFIPEHAEPSGLADADAHAAAHQVGGGDIAAAQGGEDARESALDSPCQPPIPDSWRREVAARVNHYRGKRPRAPRYPSLQLRFEPSDPAGIEPQSDANSIGVTSHGQLAITLDLEPAPESFCVQPVYEVPTAASDGTAKILEFPRSSLMPPVGGDELAEPVFDRPRILEVPEVLPAPPALGGMLIEPLEAPKDERRPGFELPLKPARLTRRILAGMTDAIVVAAAFAGFAYIFFRITASTPPVREGLAVSAALLAGFWSAYQYLLLVHCGSTPGLKLARLELSRFDGRAVPRKLRQWRVLASVLSGLSLALGYVWCFMDEDELCWHDRITHTYMAPKAGKPAPASTSHG
jgi:uncharacterized RDD family membrane protein YckC